MPEERRFCFLDIETTGREPMKHEIIEIGCVLASELNLELLSEFSVKIKPEHLELAEPESLKLNGYNDEEWQDAVSLCEGIEKFLAAASPSIIIGQVISFDWSFLEVAFARCGISHEVIDKNFGYTRWDTKSYAAGILLKPDEAFDEKRLSLKRLAGELGVTIERSHRALDDARAAYQIIKQLRKIRYGQKTVG